MQPYVDLSHLSRPSFIEVEEIRARLAKMSDTELITFARQMRGPVCPRTYDYRGKPTVSAFSIQLDEARAEWRRRYPRGRSENT